MSIDVLQNCIFPLFATKVQRLILSYIVTFAKTKVKVFLLHLHALGLPPHSRQNVVNYHKWTLAV